ncbi:heterokaryon incompatibility protein-domain-containing protein [Nemania sp. FL0916]|nr:heterokaryon incompatibility protein-domain-containing protein [Nemania sp. FL0916]
MIRLVVTAPEDSGLYFALSHRWGTSKKLLLTKKTFESLRSGMDVQGLPQTYQDSVRVAKQFGCSFLWIDSLCIFQDDIGDWLSESTQMASIYHNAVCVIAAHSAYDDSQGFLQPDKSLIVPHHSYRHGIGTFNHLVNESHLSKRGWVFQERILSKRTLHFTPEAVFLEDASGVLQIHEEGLLRPQDYVPATENRLNLDDCLHDPASWYKIIKRYSGCELACDIDRLPAITGLAQIFKDRTDPGNFLFGLWDKSLHMGLIWRQLNGSPITHAYHSGLRCPSWSWAAWTGSIDYPVGLEACTSMIEFAPKHEAPAVMALDGLLAQYSKLVISGELFELNQVEATLEALSEHQQDPGQYTQRACLIMSQCPQLRFRAFIDGSHVGAHQNYNKIELLPVVSLQRQEHIMVEIPDREDKMKTVIHSTIFYLILEETETQNHYRRLGMGKYNSGNGESAPDNTPYCLKNGRKRTIVLV